jgi:hypothetical protein
MRTRRLLFIAGLIVALIANACYESQQACLDVRAVNYYAGADENCCCRYPKLILSSDQVYDTLLFRLDSLYPADNGQLFRIKNIVFYISDVDLGRAGETVRTSDSLQLRLYNASGNDTLRQWLRDDATLVRRSPLDNQVATFSDDGNFDRIKFRIGLSDDLDRVIPALAPASHPLYSQKENLHNGDGYVFLRAVIVRNSDPSLTPDTLDLTAPDIPDLFIESQGDFYHELGRDFRLTLHADWARLFDGVDLSVYDIPQWKIRMASNLRDVFSVSQ